jgi:hypothetical protein
VLAATSIKKSFVEHCKLIRLATSFTSLSLVQWKQKLGKRLQEEVNTLLDDEREHFAIPKEVPENDVRGG